jgi:uncharacterized protein YeaO (DUF488 family)
MAELSFLVDHTERSETMIKAKHVLERIESDDGPRMWIEPIGLTKDLQEWRCVDQVLPHLGPPRDLWEWFVAHPDGYEFFRGQYHEWLSGSPYRPALQWLACECLEGNLTLLHAGDDADHNCATALYEFISELEAYCPREQP